NMLSVERQHEQPNGAANLGVRILDVVPEGGLSVRPGRDQPARVVPPRAEGVADESSDGVAALVPERLGGPRPPGVLTGQGDARLDVAVLERVREAGDELPLLG